MNPQDLEYLKQNPDHTIALARECADPIARAWYLEIVILGLLRREAMARARATSHRVTLALALAGLVVIDTLLLLTQQ